MNNKRELKRVINFVCDELLAECVAVSMYHGKPDKENVDTLFLNIIDVRNDFISRISHPEPGMPAKKYFADVRRDFNEHISEIIDHIGNLV